MKNAYRTTKCFGAWSKNKDGTHYDGAYPNGFMNWIKKMGWHEGKICHLCSGPIEDPGSFRVDIKPEVKPDLVADARKTGLKAKSFDVVMIDPPYSRELAEKLYDTEKYYSSINMFTKEAARICKIGGLVITLSYEIPKRVHNSEFIAVCGIYTTPPIGYMRCLTVSKRIK